MLNEHCRRNAEQFRLPHEYSVYGIKSQKHIIDIRINFIYILSENQSLKLRLNTIARKTSFILYVLQILQLYLNTINRCFLPVCILDTLYRLNRFMKVLMYRVVYWIIEKLSLHFLIFYLCQCILRTPNNIPWQTKLLIFAYT